MDYGGEGALPVRFRRPRVLVVGCGDVGTRVLPRLNGVRGAGVDLIATAGASVRRRWGGTAVGQSG